jgi:hypothetical protein
MEVNLVMQEDGSSICGHCCVAMATNTDIETVIELFGHEHSTRTKELHSVLKKLNVKADQKLTRKNSKNDLPNNCIIKITYDWRKNYGHWIYFNNGKCYDPVGAVYDLNKFDNPRMGRITSFLKLYV